MESYAIQTRLKGSNGEWKDLVGPCEDKNKLLKALEKACKKHNIHTDFDHRLVTLTPTRFEPIP